MSDKSIERKAGEEPGPIMRKLSMEYLQQQGITVPISNEHFFINKKYFKIAEI